MSRKDWKRRRRQQCILFICIAFLLCALVVVGVGTLLWQYLTSTYEKDIDQTSLNIEEDEEEEAPQLRETEIDMNSYPEELQALLERNPETYAFVTEYYEKKDLRPEIDLSGEVKKGVIPHFLQWDERWGYQAYGDDMIGLTGCGPTSLAMVQCGLSGDTIWSPLAVAVMAERNGFYEAGVGSKWTLMSEGAELIGLTVHEVAFEKECIIETLEAGHPIICIVGPGTFTQVGHFLVLTGVDEDGKIIIRDSNSKSRSEKTWDLDELMPEILNLWAYSYM